VSSTGSISTNGSTIQFSGLASGLDTSSIIQALLAAEKAPITRLTAQQEKLSAQQTQLAALQSSLQALTFASFELTLPSLFEGAQTVTSSAPALVTATINSGAALGGYEVEVTHLASSAQRSFTFKSPAAEDTIEIEGREYAVKAGTTAAELAAKINSDGKGTVFAAVQGEGKIVLSSRTTGAAEGGEFVEVQDAGGTLQEIVGSAREGHDAEYAVDGAPASSPSNTVTEAIPGVTLTLGGLTTSGAVTIAVQPPAPNVSAIEKQLESFVSQYNAAVEAIQTQLTTKPLANPQNATEMATGSLYGDSTLGNLLSAMRESMYEPIEGLPAEMSSPLSLGISTGASSGGKTSQAALSGLLKLEPAKLAKAIQEDPEAARTMMQKWALSFNKLVEAVSAPGGSLETRINGDSEQVREMKTRITSMNEILEVRQKALEQTYAELEAVISQNSAQSSWLTQQTEQLQTQGL
jgi:flagellar hook-associated protein 2